MQMDRDLLLHEDGTYGMLFLDYAGQNNAFTQDLGFDIPVEEFENLLSYIKDFILKIRN